jgi:S1-C subfamily serine protease
MPSSKRKKEFGEESKGSQKKSRHDRKEEDEGGDDEGDDGGDWLVDCLKGVVKVFCTTTKPNYCMPWQMEAQRTCSGTGCLLSGRRILTNAHVAEYGTTLMLLKHGDPKRYLARVFAFGHEYDLALLEVVEDADEFWQDVVPLVLGELPALNSNVLMLGYPTMDVDSVSVTEGVLSRVMMDVYSHSTHELLRLQVSAALNHGNSGGPAIVDGKLIGVASEVLEDTQNIGYAIPASVVEHFLTQIKTAKVKSVEDPYPSICDLGIGWMTCENPSLRSFYKLNKQDHGVVICKILPLSVCNNILLVDDVVTAIDGCAVADDGTIELRKSGERVKLTYAASRKFSGDTCRFTVKRNGASTELSVKLSAEPTKFTLHRITDRPQYYVWSGLVFLQCSNKYLEEEFPAADHYVNFERMPLNLQTRWCRDDKKYADQDVVVLSQVLADELCIGYLQYKNRIVEKINGLEIRNLNQLATLLNKLDPKTQPFVSVQLDGSRTIVLETARALKAHPNILARNNIYPPARLLLRNSCAK